MKRIILEYFSLLLFVTFNGENGRFIPLVWKFKWEEMKWVKWITHSSLFF